MRLHLLFVALWVAQVEGIWMMMKKDDGQMALSTATTLDDASASTQEVSATCVSPELLDSAKEETRAAESALEKARQAEQKARQELGALQTEVSTLRKEAETAAAESKKFDDILAALSKIQTKSSEQFDVIQQQTSKLEQSTVVEQMSSYHQALLSELSELGTKSETYFSTLQTDGKVMSGSVDTGRIAELEKENAAYAGELKALRELYDRLDQKYDAKMQQEEKEKLAYFAASLDKEVAKVVAEREKAWDAKLKQVTDELNERAQMNADVAAQVHKKQVTALRQKIDDGVKALEGALAAGKTQAEAVQQATERQRSLENKVTMLEHSLRNEEEMVRKAREEAKKVDSNLKQSFEEREKQKKEYLKKMDELRAELRASQDETAYWKKAFSTRSYFNVTHVMEDVVVFVKDTRELVTEKVSEAKAQSLDFVKEQNENIHKVVDPHIRTAAKFYDDHLSVHVQAADAVLRPLYHEHVAPHVAEGQHWFRQKKVEVVKTFDDSFNDLVSQAKRQCKVSRVEIESAPEFIRKHVRNACKYPDTAIRVTIKMIVILFVFLLRKPILRLVWGTVTFVVRFILYVISFGYLGRSKPKSVVASADEPNEPSSSKRLDSSANLAAQ